MRGLIVFGVMIGVVLMLASPLQAAHAGKDALCQGCHALRDADVVMQWRSSTHQHVSCTECHGPDHNSVIARRGELCRNCHAGPATHSYQTSKHGVIVKLEQRDWDWSRPLTGGNYRAPSCAYCHFYQGNHGSSTVAADANGEKDPINRWLPVCGGCHSPRYIREQLDAGQRLIEIGEKKLAEALAVQAQAAEKQIDTGQMAVVIKTMREKHLPNLHLGSGHQSPDYQWWHGQPALDGDLLRIKGLLSGALRQRQLHSE